MPKLVGVRDDGAKLWQSDEDPRRGFIELADGQQFPEQSIDAIFAHSPHWMEPQAAIDAAHAAVK